MKPLVDIIIPTKSIDLRLLEAVKSVSSQGHQSSTLIIHDGGSVDEFALKQIESLRNIRLERNQNPPGVANALNYGLSITSGKYVMRMDADDLSEPQRLTNQLKLISENAADATFSGIKAIDSRGEKLVSPRVSLPVGLFWKPALLLGNCLYHPTLFCTRDWIERGGGYQNVLGEDYDLWLRNQSGKIFISDQKLIKYRFHSHQTSKTIQNLTLVEQLLPSYSRLLVETFSELGEQAPFLLQLVTGTRSRPLVSGELSIIKKMIQLMIERGSKDLNGHRREVYAQWIANRTVRLLKTKAFLVKNEANDLHFNYYKSLELSRMLLFWIGTRKNE